MSDTKIKLNMAEIANMAGEEQWIIDGLQDMTNEYIMEKYVREASYNDKNWDVDVDMFFNNNPEFKDKLYEYIVYDKDFHTANQEEMEEWVYEDLECYKKGEKKDLGYGFKGWVHYWDEEKENNPELFQELIDGNIELYEYSDEVYDDSYHFLETYVAWDVDTAWKLIGDIVNDYLIDKQNVEEVVEECITCLVED